MKKHWPWLLFAVFAIEAAFSLKPRADKPDEFQLREWAKLPVLANGRVQPFDSLARNSLLVIRGNTDVPLEGNGANGAWGKWETLQGPLSERNWYQFSKRPAKLKPAEWLLEVFSKPELADTRAIFLIHHAELIGELKLQDKGVERSGLRYYTFADIKPSLGVMERESKKVGEIKQELRTPYQRSLMGLHNGLQTYLRLKNSLKPENTQDFAAELAQFEKLLPAGFKAIRAQQSGQDYDKAMFDTFLGYAEPYAMMGQMAYPFLVPPTEPGQKKSDWTNIGQALMNGIRAGEVPTAVHAHAALATAYAQGKPAEFNRALADYRAFLAGKLDIEVKKGRQESLFNQFSPFYRSMMIYVLAFILAVASWLTWSTKVNKAAFLLFELAFLVHTTGLLFRMFLEGRPPVTNLYSSAIFVGWGAVLLGVVLEYLFRNGIGTAVSSVIGFITLIVAHHLAQTSSTGDTMEMMRAVLDTNFWLATHVTTITIGYASTFLAGFLAMIYVLLGVFTKRLTQEWKPTDGVGVTEVVLKASGHGVAAAALTQGSAPADPLGKSLPRMVYGIVCFATLLSFVGTILGGIWADQSWGRFWGWDPKENGALLIVIWNALILHARWGGLVRERGLMNLALFGNIVTAWSWFGTNMLGVGLHSYGFMDAAFKWLMIFNLSQLILIGLGCLPTRFWKSGQGPAAGGGTKAEAALAKPQAA